MFCSFLINGIVFGIINTYGILFVKLKESLAASGGGRANGSIISYQLDAARLQDQDQLPQPNGHVPAIQKTPTICQQFSKNGNVAGLYI